MAYDKNADKALVADLLYPTALHRKMSLSRRNFIAEKSVQMKDDLMLENLSKLICPGNPYKMCEILMEFPCDIEIINYRQDILEDLYNLPKLPVMLKKVIDTMIAKDKRDIYKISAPDTFTSLNGAVEAFEAYIECMQTVHKFIAECGENIKSQGMLKLTDFFEQKYKDKHFQALCENISELRKLMDGRIKSITVAINVDENLLPISAGIVNISNEAYTPKPTVLDKIIYGKAKFSENVFMDNVHERYIFENGDRHSKDKIVNDIEKPLFEDLDEITKKYIRLIEKALDEYQAIGFEQVRAIDYQLDFYMGIIQLRESVEGKGLKMCRPKILPKEAHKSSLKGAFDLIYFGEACLYNFKTKDKRQVVTNDISFDKDGGFYILTGANNGGKTTFVRAVGICQVMAQAGFFVAAQECEISICDCIYTHFPKEEQKGIDSSKFTSEIKQFKQIIDNITQNSLLLMNESIQSTTPNECIDIASKLVTLFCKKNVRGIFATHLIDLGLSVGELNERAGGTVIKSIVAMIDDNGKRSYVIKEGEPMKNSFAQDILKEFGIDIR